MELSKLAEKDPEFYKFLQENDRELLEFDPNADGGGEQDENDETGDEGMQEDKVPVLTKSILQRWQRALLEVGPVIVNSNAYADLVFRYQQRSLRALRKLLIAFRSAVHMNEEDQVLAWTIDNPSSTSLRIRGCLF